VITPTPTTLSILGSTGSIGTQTLEIAQIRGYSVVALAAGNNLDLLERQMAQFKPSVVSISSEKYLEAKARFAVSFANTRVCDDPCEVAQFGEVVLGAIPGLGGCPAARRRSSAVGSDAGWPRVE
jgi:1-deoxy-D-xylulose-5-phosphate reductoisomerase